MAMIFYEKKLIEQNSELAYSKQILN